MGTKPTTWMVAVNDGSRILYAIDGSGECWSDRPQGGLTRTEADAIVAVAVEAGAAYDVVRDDGTLIREAGTAALVPGVRQ